MSETNGTQRLRHFVERIERLQEDRKAIGDDIADLFKELDGEGFDKHAVKAILKIRAADDGLAVWTERSATVDLYLSALGMLAAHAPARAHVEKIEQFPASTTPGRKDSVAGIDGPSSAENEVDKISATISNPASDALGGAAGQTPDVKPPSASGVAIPERRVNPQCRKAATGKPCALSHSMASCSICADIAARQKVAA